MTRLNRKSPCLTAALSIALLAKSVPGICQQLPLSDNAPPTRVADGKVMVNVKALGVQGDYYTSSVAFEPITPHVSCQVTAWWDGQVTSEEDINFRSADFKEKCDQIESSTWEAKIERPKQADFKIVDDRDEVGSNPVPAPEGAQYETIDQDKWYGPRRIYVGRKVPVIVNNAPIVGKREIHKSVSYDIGYLYEVTAEQAVCPKTQLDEAVKVLSDPKYSPALKTAGFDQLQVLVKDNSAWTLATRPPNGVQLEPSADLNSPLIHLTAVIAADGKCLITSAAALKLKLDNLVAQYKLLPKALQPSLDSKSVAKTPAPSPSAAPESTTAALVDSKPSISINAGANHTRICYDTRLADFETRKLPFVLQAKNLVIPAGKSEIQLGLSACYVMLKNASDKDRTINTEGTALWFQSRFAQANESAREAIFYTDGASPIKSISCIAQIGFDSALTLDLLLQAFKQTQVIRSELGTGPECHGSIPTVVTPRPSIVYTPTKTRSAPTKSTQVVVQSRKSQSVADHAPARSANGMRSQACQILEATARADYQADFATWDKRYVDEVRYGEIAKILHEAAAALGHSVFGVESTANVRDSWDQFVSHFHQFRDAQEQAHTMIGLDDDGYYKMIKVCREQTCLTRTGIRTFADVEALSAVTADKLLAQDHLSKYMSPDDYVKQRLSADSECGKEAKSSGEQGDSRLAMADSAEQAAPNQQKGFDTQIAEPSRGSGGAAQAGI